ncbi:MAG: amino acid adenylation domain-containing protein, partial [Ruminococcus sp.]|nr:amino acid adenylation domain-containing protein [Candidatus Copronaster equi]
LLSSVEEAVKCFLNNEILKEMTIVSSDCKKIIDEANDTQQDFINVSVNRLIESHAEKTPDKLAVKACGRELTFDELNRLANRIAHSLYDCGVKQNNIIGMIFDRTVEISYVELGILKAGGAFLAILPSYPDDRIDFCLTNAESPIVITTQEIKESRPELLSEDKPYIVKTLEELLQNTNEENLNLDIDTNSLAYCIYTSGSTGTPKGVMIEHHNFANIVQTDNFPYEYYTGPKSGKTALALSSISFDMSIFDNLMQLCNGISVIIATDDDIHNPLALAKLMKENHVELMSCTPSFINNYVTMKEFFPALEHLKTIVVGAEAFPGALYNELKKINPEMNVINGYGPTECTITCCAKILNDSKNVTIGKPLSNTKFYVMDKFGNVLPPYACGELIICGECVGRGYIGLPEKNKASFFTFNGIPAYHSGDLVRMNCDGEIEFCGRIDNQVKLRGFRVELDEIENVICSFSGVKQSKVVVRNNGTEDYLAGFFTAENVIEIEELTGFLKTKLTYYMVPDIIMQLEQMPLTQSGKIDKKALPESTKKSKKAGKKRAPKKSLEQQLCEIFKSVLNLEEVYADDNFFELGGTSLSAAKVTMMLMSENIEVKYGDIFDNPTPENLAEFIHLRDAKAKSDEKEKTEKAESTTRDTLKYNVIKYSNQVRREMLGNVLLTGAVGFLGIHILRELINSEEGHIWCLVRKGKYENPLSRLKTMLVYYFSESFEDALENRITVIDADITDSTLQDTLSDVDFDTVINCAACVKHFADDDILERINVHGVENLINLCQDRNAKMIQISTVSVPGIHTQESWEKQIRMHENELFVIDDMDNKYGISKYHAELKMFDAIDNGLKGKVIRVGNLMGRHSDGEFQVNLETNMFLSGIRGFALMGKYPISHMIDPMKFSPIDCTARAVVLLAGTNDMFTAFNVDNRYGFDEMKVIDACNRNGIKIVPTEDEAYYNEFRQKLGDERVNAKLNGLAAYDIKDAHAVETDNLFTTNILYRIGFSWPLVDDAYLDRAINSILTLDYFNVDEVEQ